MKKSVKFLITLLLLIYFPAAAHAAFKVVSYTGNGGTQQITGVGFQPDFVWVKNRVQDDTHQLADSVRGPFRTLRSEDATGEQSLSQGIQSYDNDGFTIGSHGSYNNPGINYVAWCWKDSPASGLDIIKYNGSGVENLVNHDLGKVARMVMIKRLDAIEDWVVYHQGIDGATPDNYYLKLNEADGKQSSNWINHSTAGFNVYSVGNADGGQYVAYVFSDIAGVSSFGSYTGNGSATGPVVDCGFEPSFVMAKRSDGTGNWNIWDNKRNPANPKDECLFANSISNAVIHDEYKIDFTSTGFQLKGTNVGTNTSGGEYIYMAFAETAFDRSGTFTVDGKVGIGVTNPTDALEVKGSIKAQEIIVTIDDWADYVFDQGYDLKDLSLVDAYIRQNHHLPGIPSADQLGSQGLPVSRMFELQMQKIEELTLYLIELSKKNKQLEERIRELE